MQIYSSETCRLIALDFSVPIYTSKHLYAHITCVSTFIECMSIQCYHDNPDGSASGLCMSIQCYHDNPDGSASGLCMSIQCYHDNPDGSASGLCMSIQCYHDNPDGSASGLCFTLCCWSQSSETLPRMLSIMSNVCSAISMACTSCSLCMPDMA